MNEIKMTVKEAIEQLTDLKRDREYYNQFKDAEDRCKKIEKQNKRLKELLKLAFEEIYKISELNEDVCFMECDSCNDCSFVYEETGICKWKHADEVEEVLKDE